MEKKPRVFLFDAYALIYRAFYAFINRPMINSKGVNTSAIYGFTITLMDIIKREVPEYAAVVFDPPYPTFRHELYHEYKANRLATPEEIKKSVPVIKMIVDAFNIPGIEVNWYEADDVIGTLARKSEAAGFTTYMVTPDKDFMQLVNEHTKMLKPSKSGVDYEVVGVAEAKKFFEVDNPARVTDILALWGDSSDNIPGAPGIGEKTAKELIAKYHSLENLLEHINELKPKQRESLTTNLEQVKMSYKLAKIVTDVPLEVDFSNLLVRKWNEQKLKEIFLELEFKTLVNRAFKNSAIEPTQGNLFAAVPTKIEETEKEYHSIMHISHQYHVVNEESDLKDLINNLNHQPAFCFDTETTGLNTKEAELVGMSFSFSPHEAYYVPVSQDFKSAMALMNRFREVFGNPAIRKIGQNLKFDLQVLMNYDMAVDGELFDTMIAHYLIQPDLKHNLEYLAEVYLQYQMVPIEDLIGKKGNSKQKSMREVDLAVIKEYAGEDADITWQLYQILREDLKSRNLWQLAMQVEMPLVRVLAEIERSGFKIDEEILQNYSSLLKKELIEIESTIYHSACQKFNINSPKQMGEVLFEKMQIADGTQKTKTKQFSTSEDVLLKIANKHPIINQILEFRGIQKLLSTYVDALPQLIDNKTGKIHSSFDQAWVSTGRLSSRNPNLQNIPIREERGREIRKAFIPSSNQQVLLSADYSQIELRLMAHLSKDENMIAAFLKSEDIHVSTAAKVFKVKEQEVTPSMRSSAKTANFGIIYGISSFGLSQRLNISRADSSTLIGGYFNSFPGVKEYMDNAIQIAKEKGYVETIMGRRRYLPDIHSANAIVRGVAERNAINAPIQGSAADIIKLAMVNIQRNLRDNFKTTMILQVHDELIFDVFKEELERIEKMVRYEMECVLKLDVPLLVDIRIGNNWLEAH
jgi:DNA polymerase-1